MQFRAIEFTLGMKRRGAVDHYPEGTPARKELESRYVQSTLWDSFLHFVAAQGYAVPRDLLERDVTQPVVSSDSLQNVLIDVYRRDLVVRDLCERMVDLDEGVQEWRYRHVRMVERTIGFRRGTGGSAGAAYLRDTVFNHAFPDLWEIRTEL
jgi:tryptophan 2,3-dioxygenase